MTCIRSMGLCMYIKACNFLNLHLFQAFLLTNFLVNDTDAIIGSILGLIACHDWLRGRILLQVPIIVDQEYKIVNEELACIYVVIRDELANQILLLCEVKQNNALTMPILEEAGFVISI
jgi:hypothetical protein